MGQPVNCAVYCQTSSARSSRPFLLEGTDMSRSTPPSHIAGSTTSSSRSAKTAAATHAVLESLEKRAMFTVSPDPGADFAHAFNVGELNGSVTLDDTVG